MTLKRRKSVVATEEATELKQKIDGDIARLKEIEELQKAALQEEIDMVNYVRSEIDKLCKAKSLRCELQLTIKDVLAILELFVTSKQPIVTVGYGLYYYDPEVSKEGTEEIINP